MKRIVYTLLFSLAGFLAHGQVKVGANPGSITSGAVLDIEGSTTTTRTVSLTNGNLGIGNTTPNAPLQFSNGLTARKIVLWEGAFTDNNFFGFGVQPNMLRYQVNSLADDHVFLAGANSLTASAELMRIKGNGNVGIGTATPALKLQVNTNANAQQDVGFGNQSGGSSALMAIRLYNDIGNAFLFLNSSTRSGDGGANALTLRNDAGLLRLQSKAAAGISVDLNGNSTVDGTATIKNIPLSGGTVMLTADNDGVVRKQALPVASAPVILGTRPSGAPDGINITATSPGPSAYSWTGLQIVIPAGSSYIINSVQLLTTAPSPGQGTGWTYSQGAHFFLRTGLSTSSTTFTPATGSNSSGSLISGQLDGPLGILSGQTRVVNGGTTPLTLYYFAGASIDSGASFNTSSNGVAAIPFTGTLFRFGGGWGETQFYAIPTAN